MRPLPAWSTPVLEDGLSAADPRRRLDVIRTVWTETCARITSASPEDVVPLLARQIYCRALTALLTTIGHAGRLDRPREWIDSFVALVREADRSVWPAAVQAAVPLTAGADPTERVRMLGALAGVAAADRWRELVASIRQLVLDHRISHDVFAWALADALPGAPTSDEAVAVARSGLDAPAADLAHLGSTRILLRALPADEVEACWRALIEVPRIWLAVADMPARIRDEVIARQRTSALAAGDVEALPRLLAYAGGHLDENERRALWAQAFEALVQRLDASPRRSLAFASAARDLVNDAALDELDRVRPYLAGFDAAELAKALGRHNLVRLAASPAEVARAAWWSSAWPPWLADEVAARGWADQAALEIVEIDRLSARLSTWSALWRHLTEATRERLLPEVRTTIAAEQAVRSHDRLRLIPHLGRDEVAHAWERDGAPAALDQDLSPSNVLGHVLPYLRVLGGEAAITAAAEAATAALSVAGAGAAPRQ